LPFLTGISCFWSRLVLLGQLPLTDVKLAGNPKINYIYNNTKINITWQGIQKERDGFPVSAT
jgi:hypothetical protein